MNLKFNPEAKVTEWVNGPLYFKNEGDDLEGLKPSLAKAMLEAKHEVQPGQFVNIFILANQDKPTTKKAAAIISNDYPNDFPHADKLTKAGLTFDAVRVLNKEQLVSIEGVGNASADAILAALKEN
jgi:hypothetical protein